MTEIEELWQLIDIHVSPLAEETVPVAAAARRVAAAEVRAAADLPAFDQSAMDGYAFAEDRPGRCRIVGTVAAGDAPPPAPRAGEAIRIFTGAPVPEGVFAVAMQEDCAREGEWVALAGTGNLLAGQHIRRRAEAVRAGGVLIPCGKKILPGAVGLLASCGVEQVSVVRRPQVEHIATGSELHAPGAPARPGKIPDSNGPMIEALLAAEAIGCRRRQLQDDFAALRECVREFAGDLLLISGGSGPGDHDHTRRALEEAGFRVLCERLNSRPGKPLLFAVRGGQAAFGLPGNPLSHWVCYQAFVRRALARMEAAPPPELISAFCPDWRDAGGDGRRTWTPARVRSRGGRLEIEPLRWCHSGDLSPLAEADALALDSPEAQTQLIPILLL